MPRRLWPRTGRRQATRLMRQRMPCRKPRPVSRPGPRRERAGTARGCNTFPRPLRRRPSRGSGRMARPAPRPNSNGRARQGRAHLSSDPRVRTARTLVRLQRFAEALTLLKPLALEDRPDQTDVRFLLGLASQPGIPAARTRGRGTPQTPGLSHSGVSGPS